MRLREGLERKALVFVWRGWESEDNNGVRANDDFTRSKMKTMNGTKIEEVKLMSIHRKNSKHMIQIGLHASIITERKVLSSFFLYMDHLDFCKWKSKLGNTWQLSISWFKRGVTGFAHSGKSVNGYAIPLAKTGFPYQWSSREEASWR
jgi:hypothetical protein